MEITYESDSDYDEGYICVFCNDKFFDFGNNPSPIKCKGRCCNQCNWSVIIKKRLEMIVKDAEDK